MGSGSADGWGAFVARAWIEDELGGGLRIRITTKVDVGADAEETFVVDRAEEACDVLNDWIERFLRQR